MEVLASTFAMLQFPLYSVCLSAGLYRGRPGLAVMVVVLVHLGSALLCLRFV